MRVSAAQHREPHGKWTSAKKANHTAFMICLAPSGKLARLKLNIGPPIVVPISDGDIHFIE